MHLRWVLSFLGIVFVIAVFLWERRKQQPRSRAASPLAARDAPSFDSNAATHTLAHPPVDWSVSRPREVAQPLPVVEFDDDGQPDDSFGPVGEARPLRHESPEYLESLEEFPSLEPVEHSAELGQSEPLTDERMPEPAAFSVTSVSEPDVGAVRLEWPEEAERQIVAARVIPLGDRFGGRVVRQALAGEGFVHGPLGIFHRALADGRVVISCASLTKPGNFDLTSMDSLRFSGLSLFGVLPGPLTASATLEELATVARRLASRLGGLAQDDRGQALDANRIAELKATLSGPAYLPRGALPTQGPGEHAP